MLLTKECLKAELQHPSQPYQSIKPQVDLSDMTPLELGSLVTSMDAATQSGNDDAWTLAVSIRNQAAKIKLTPAMDQKVFLEAVRASTHVSTALKYFTYLNDELPDGLDVEARRLLDDFDKWFDVYDDRYYQAYYMARIAGEDKVDELRQVLHQKYPDARFRQQEFELFSRLNSSSAFAFTRITPFISTLHWLEKDDASDHDPVRTLAADPVYMDFARAILTYAARHIEEIHSGNIAYKSDAAFSTIDTLVLVRAAGAASLRDEPWFREVIATLLPKVCYAPTSAKTAPSQSLAIALGQLTEAVPTPESVQALREAIRDVRHAGLKKKLMRNIKPAERMLIERTDIARPAPRMGLDDNGTLTLNFGPRHFIVAFDETLKPYVKDGNGVRLKELPKPIKSDDAALAEAAVAQYKHLKTGVKAVASLQLNLLELAMSAGRRWSVAEFGEFFLHHPLMRHLAARLVWVACSEAHSAQYFRVAEDLSLADHNDMQCHVGDDAQIGIAHMLDMPEAAFQSFGQIFSDYEILQPFKQLARETYTLNDAELADTILKRYEDKTVSIGSLMGLFNRGWKRGETEDGGNIYHFAKRIATDLDVCLALDPGVHVTDMRLYSTQRLPSLSLRRSNSRYGGDVPFSNLDRVTISEILRDIDLMAPLKE